MLVQFANKHTDYLCVGLSIEGMAFRGPFRRPRAESGGNGHIHDGDHRPIDMMFEPRDVRTWHESGPFGPPTGKLALALGVHDFSI